jgi:hypothetical protein
MDDELRSHLEAQADDLMHRRNLSASDAMRLARMEFGALDKYKEEGRQARGLQWLDQLTGDVRFAVRQLRPAPAFTSVTILTLAIGIGANTAAFARLNEALWQTLPFPHPE